MFFTAVSMSRIKQKYVMSIKWSSGISDGYIVRRIGGKIIFMMPSIFLNAIVVLSVHRNRYVHKSRDTHPNARCRVYLSYSTSTGQLATHFFNTFQSAYLVEFLITAFYDWHPVARKEFLATYAQQRGYKGITSLSVV